MKATGIVRRIDDLGRVVIPKEIRKTMRLKEGAPLEIYTDKDGEIIFKKYSLIGELSNYVGVFSEIINKSTGKTVAVADKDRIIAVSGSRKKELLERRITKEIENFAEERRNYIYKIGDPRVHVTEAADESDDLYAGMVCPILVEGDVIGSIILLLDDSGAAPSETEVQILTTSTQLLARQLES